MANYVLQWASGVPYLSILPSEKVENIDEFLTKVPNFQEGSAHITSGTVSIDGGASLVFWVKGGFRADSALITVPSAKSITFKSGSDFIAEPGSDLLIEGDTIIDADVAVQGGLFTWQADANVNFYSEDNYFLQGSGLIFSGLLGNIAQLNIGQYSRMFVSNTGAIDLDSGSDITFKSGSLTALNTGAFFNVYTTLFAVKPGGKITVDGSGSVAQIIFDGGNALCTLQDGAELTTINALVAFSTGTTFTLTSSCTTSDASTRTRSGPEILSGNGASTRWRQQHPSNATQTLTVQNGDTFYIPTGVSADITYTLAQPSPVAAIRAKFKRKCSGAEAGAVFLATHSGPNIVKFNQGNSTEAGAEVEYNVSASRWEPLLWSGNVGGSVTPGQPL
jgi:hypothetical protein